MGLNQISNKKIISKRQTLMKNIRNEIKQKDQETNQKRRKKDNLPHHHLPPRLVFLKTMISEHSKS